MPKQHLHELLDRLNAEIAAAGPLDDDAKSKLHTLELQIRDRLEASEEPKTAEPTLAEPVQSAIDHFEKTHPTLTMTLGRIMDILNKMGI